MAFYQVKGFMSFLSAYTVIRLGAFFRLREAIRNMVRIAGSGSSGTARQYQFREYGGILWNSLRQA
jgi:hypothetical protein